MIKAYLSALRERQFPVAFPGHFISGTMVSCDRGNVVKDVINPSTGESLMTFRLDRGLLNQALADSDTYSQEFARSKIPERLEWLAKFREALVDYREDILLTLKTGGGKPHWEAEIEFDASVKFLDDLLSRGENLFDNATSLFGRPSHTKINLAPQGTVLAHIPFSIPCISLTKFIAISLVSACPIVAMATAHASLFSSLIALIIQELDLPKPAIHVLSGNFEMFRMGAQDRRAKVVMYRGSREHCMTIHRESHDFISRPTILNSGGKNSVLVHESASIEEAVDIAMFGAFKSAGQLCSSTSQVILPTSMMAAFTDMVVAKARNMNIGPTDGEGNPTMGPLYSDKQVDKFLRFQTMAKREAQKTILWGKQYRCDKPGFFVSPGIHIMEMNATQSAYQSNVLLFPDLALYEYQNISDATAFVNHNDAPLAMSIVTGDTGWIAEHQYTAPNIMINGPTVELDAQLPVSGRGYSGNVRQGGAGLMEVMTYPVALQDGQAFKGIFDSWKQNLNG